MTKKRTRWTPEHLAAYAIARLFFTLGRFGPGGPEYSDLDKALGSVIPFFVIASRRRPKRPRSARPFEAAAA